MIGFCELPNILFWNTNGNEHNNLIVRACQENQVDILILAEYNAEKNLAANQLNFDPLRPITELPQLVSRVRIFTRYPSSFFTSLFENKYCAIHNLTLPIGKSIILAAAHMPSKLNQDEDSQHASISIIAREIIRCERESKHDNSIVIGDLNVNPFEKSMAAADGFHAVMDKAIAMRVSRKFLDVEYKYFYNPMWSRLGDESSGPAGSYYYNSVYKNYFWNTFDQVLLRPSLLPYYDSRKLKIITKIGDQDLIKNGLIDKNNSDHLPLFIGLETEK